MTVKRMLVIRLCIAFALVVMSWMAFVTPALAATTTATVTCNGVQLNDSGVADPVTIQKGQQVTCTWQATDPHASFFFMVGRGFSPLFAHSTTSTFTAGNANAFASITVYWTVPGTGSVTATFPYIIQNPPS